MSEFNKIKRAQGSQFSIPDIVEPMLPSKTIQTRGGYLTPAVADSKSYKGSGYKFKAYTYIATGRYFSTAVAPTEYGDGDVFDGLICLIHTKGMPNEAIKLLKPTAIVKITRSQYVDEGGYYRIVTGNPYADHVELKAVPIEL